MIALRARPRTSLGRFFAAYPAAYWFLMLGTVISGLATFVLPFETLYLTVVRGFPIAEAAFTASLFGIGSCLSSMLGGWLSDHIGRRPVILGSMLLLVLTTLLLSIASSLSWIAVLSFLYGFWTAAYRPASQAAVNDLVPGAKQKQANTLLYWGYNLGIAISPFVASIMIRLASYSLLFVADAAGTLAFCALVYWFVPESWPGRHPVVSTTGALRKAKPGKGGVLRDSVFLSFVALVFAIACLYFQNGSTLPLDMARHGIRIEQYSLAIAMNGLAVVFLTLPLSRLFLRWSPFRALGVAALLYGIGYGLMALAGWFRSLPLYTLSVLIWTLGEILYTPSSANVVAELAPEHRRGLYQGLLMMAWGLASFVGPTAGGLLLAWSSTFLWAACLVAGIVIGLGFACVGLVHQQQRKLRLQEVRARYKYPVELDKHQRRFLEVISKMQRGMPALERLHAEILLLSDARSSLPKTTEEIAAACHVTQATVVRVRRLLSERGFDALFSRARAAAPHLVRQLSAPLAYGSSLRMVAACLSALALAVQFSDYGPLIPAMLKDLHIAAGQAGLMSTLLWLGLMATCIPGGILADRYGQRPVLVSSLLLMVGGGVLLPLVPNIFWILACRVLIGFGAGAAFIAGAGIAASARRPALAQGLYGGCVQVGAGLSLLVTPWLATQVGWQGAFLSWGLLGLPALLAWLCVHEQSSAPQEKKVNVVAGLRSPAVWVLGCVHMGTFGVANTIAAWVAVYLVHQYGIGLAQAATFGALGVMAGALIRPVGGFLLGRKLVSSVALLRIGTSATCLGVAALALPLHLPILAATGMALIAFGSALPYTAVFGSAAQLRTVSKGIAQGLLSVIAWQTLLWGPPLIGLFYQSTGNFSLPFAAMLGAGVAAMIASWLAGVLIPSERRTHGSQKTLAPSQPARNAKSCSPQPPDAAQPRLVLAPIG